MENNLKESLRYTKIYPKELTLLEDGKKIILPKKDNVRFFLDDIYEEMNIADGISKDEGVNPRLVSGIIVSSGGGWHGIITDRMLSEGPFTLYKWEDLADVTYYQYNEEEQPRVSEM